MKILTVLGARPQFIKASIVSKQFKNTSINEILLHTGQHYDHALSQSFFKELEIPEPKYNLEVGSSTHSIQTGKMLVKIEKIINLEKPDILLVYGDTNSTLAAALCGAKMNLPIAHIEAGLRRYNKTIPEEINRKLTDHISDLLFVPSETAVKNLKKENILGQIIYVGDVMYDLAKEVIRLTNSKNILKAFTLEPENYIFSTLHRQENTNNKDNLKIILYCLNEFCKRGFKVILPIHPRTKKFIKQYRIDLKKFENFFFVIDPITYTESIVLIKNAKFVITDSGGVQRESYYMKTPCLISTYSTGWVEPVELGWNKIVGASKQEILSSANEIFQNNFRPKKWKPVYGNGNAAELIRIHLKSFL
jgi:UDP-N-acetylglucosamine 2-epimerase